VRDTLVHCTLLFHKKSAKFQVKAGMESVKPAD
jgi:hypothetical protein